MYCSMIWHYCSPSDTIKIEKMQLKVLQHIYQDYRTRCTILREKRNRLMLIIERQKKIMSINAYIN